MRNEQTAHLRIGGHRPGSKRHYALVSREDLERLREKKWTKHPLGYAMRYTRVNGEWKTEYLHRAVCDLGFGDTRVVDHINGDRLDNRRENLRVLEYGGLNSQNIRRTSNKATSVFRGVSKRDLKNPGIGAKLWRASVKHHELRYQELFLNEIEAALAAEQVRRVVMPYSQPDPELLRIFGNEDSLAIACKGIKIQNLDLEKIKKYS